ncbi:IS3 family transposase [Nocardia gipuzkoensis]
MPPAHPPEFRQRAIELARSSDRPIGQVAKGLGISESCLRNWLRRADIDEGARDGVTSSERKELAELRRRTRQLELENEVLRKAAAYFARENVLPKLVFPVVAQLAEAGIPVTVSCRVLRVSTSGYYEWKHRGESARARADRELTTTITDIHTASRGTYGAPRVHAELRLGQRIRVGRKRVARLMRSAGLAGIFRRRRGCTTRDPQASPHPDLVNRRFAAEGPDRLWCMDVTQHRTSEGWVYCAVVLDAFSRRIVGWSIAGHLRAELVCDALDMARWRRKPPDGQTIAHSDHGAQYTSWAFGQRIRTAGLLGSMGSIGDCFDNSMVESFFGTLQLELLDRKQWATRQELANAIFDYIETFYNPRRRHSKIGMISPVEYEQAHTPTHAAA